LAGVVFLGAVVSVRNTYEKKKRRKRGGCAINLPCFRLSLVLDSCPAIAPDAFRYKQSKGLTTTNMKLEERFPKVSLFRGARYIPFRPEVIGWTRKLKLTPLETLLLLALDWHREDGSPIVWPGLETLGEFLNLDLRNLDRCLRRLVKKKMITIEKGKQGRGVPNKYDLSLWLSAISEVANAPEQASTKKPDVSASPQGPRADLTAEIARYEAALEEATRYGDVEWQEGCRREIARLKAQERHAV
jgi:hypothetical protein